MIRRKVLETYGNKKAHWISTQNIYQNKLIMSEFGSKLYVRGNLRGRPCTWSTGATTGEATEVWAVTAWAPSFCTISSHNQTNRFQCVSAGLVFNWIMSLCPQKHQQKTEVSSFSQPYDTIKSTPIPDKNNELQLKYKLLFPSLVTMRPAEHWTTQCFIYRKQGGKGERGLKSKSRKYLGTTVSPQHEWRFLKPLRTPVTEVVATLPITSSFRLLKW